jgi:hypothetical protein
MSKTKSAKPLDYESNPDKPGGLADDVAYILPMATFLVFTWVGGTWKNLYPLSYVAKAIVVAIMLFLLRRHYTKVRWNHWWLGVIVGVVGIFQWVGMQLWLQNRFDHFKPSPDVFNPFDTFANPIVLWSFIFVRIASATLIVPGLEDLFWRDFLWRQMLAPSSIAYRFIASSTERGFGKLVAALSR